jgi:Zn-dependent protease with chaperone function
MDFFERQDQARRHTSRLIVYFVLAVLALIGSVYAVFALLLSPQRPFNPELLFWVGLGTIAVIGVGMLVKTAEMARGGRAVAEMLGGQLLNPNTTDPDERKLLNVVEEMSLASGVPVPAVYVMRNEPGINAFAAGHSTRDAAIGVTRGCMRLLNRDELQGVIAHEFSHILNGDMRLNLRLIGLIFGIMCLALIGRILLRVRGGSGGGRGQNALPVIGLALILVGWVGVLFGRLIQSAVSRQREFLADAAAVQFTRNPMGLAGALRKVGGLAYGSRVENAHAAEAGHLFFGSALEGGLAGLFATHPPLTQRIRAIDPAFDGKFPAVTLPELDAGQPVVMRFPREPAPLAGLAGMVATASPRGGPVPPRLVVVHPPRLAPSYGTPQRAHLVKAAEILEKLPAQLRDALHDGLGASAVVYALLLAVDDQVRQAQLQVVRQRIAGGMIDEVVKLAPWVAAEPVEHRLPLLELAASGLRELSPPQYGRFQETVRALVEMDGQLDLFEFVLMKILLHGVDPHFTPTPPNPADFYSLKALLPDSAVLLSALSHLGQTTPAEAEAAFARGLEPLSRITGVDAALLPVAECGIEAVDRALDRLSRGVPQIRKSVLTACAQAVAADGRVQPGEAELLRAIALALDCPLPPFVD